MKVICPYCNYVTTKHETLNKENNPIDEDISFCIDCGELSEFKNKVLIKTDIETLDKKIREEVNDIRVAWLKRRAIDNVRKNDKKT